MTYFAQYMEVERATVERASVIVVAPKGINNEGLIAMAVAQADAEDAWKHEDIQIKCDNAHRVADSAFQADLEKERNRH